MKKLLALALICCMLTGAALAIALPAGTTYEQYVAGEVYFGDFEIGAYLGRPLQEYEDEISKYANLAPGKDVRVFDSDGVIHRIMLDGGSFTIYGYKVDGRDDGIDEQMAADGWAETGGWFEGGLTLQVFEKTEGDTHYTFTVRACDSVITGLDLLAEKTEPAAE